MKVWSVTATVLTLFLGAPQDRLAQEMRQALAAKGELRAVFLASNPVQARVDPKTGDVTGPAADIVRELASRLSVPFSIRGLDGVPAVMEAVTTGNADIGFLAYDATRTVQVGFTQPYSIGHNTYMVRNDSRLRTVDDADRPGVRIGVGGGDAVDLHLTRTLKQAQLIRPSNRTMEEALRMVVAGEVDAYAANRQRLTEIAGQSSNVRLLPGSVLPVQQSIVVSKENSTGVAALNRFIDEIRDSGFLGEAIARAKLAGVEPTPK